MNIDHFKHLEDALDYLRQKQYVHTFQCHEKGWLCPETSEIFKPEELVLDDCQRFSQGHNVTVLYAVTCPSGRKGLILDNCKTYANALLGELLVRLKLHHI